MTTHAHPPVPPLAQRTGPRPVVLVIEDEPPIRRLLRATLEANGFAVEEAAGARSGLLKAAQSPPDLILLDLGLPDGDGLQVTRQIRAWSQVPIIVLSARGQEQDKVAALDAGADDYLTKPFGVPELTARLRVALRHASQRIDTDASPVYECSAEGRTLRIDLASREVTVREAVSGPHASAAPNPAESCEVKAEVVRLTPTEYRLLELLVKHAGKVLTHDFLLRSVWGPGHTGDVQYLRVYAAQLRRKIERNPALPAFLLTEPGVGYRLRAERTT